MAGRGQFKLKAIWAMMKVCAPGYTAKKTTHYYRIDYNGKRYPTFPNGEHNKKREIELGHIKKMARHFGIEECAQRELSY